MKRGRASACRARRPSSSFPSWKIRWAPSPATRRSRSTAASCRGSTTAAPNCCATGSNAARSTAARRCRSEEHTSELQSLMRISYAVFCLKKKKNNKINDHHKVSIKHNKPQQHKDKKHYYT